MPIFDCSEDFVNLMENEIDTFVDELFSINYFSINYLSRAYNSL